ncbi:MAG: hypothetical protein A2Z43_01145 [Syntrophobacterales bacterium RBG_19FT_COMBO_59_10]|nr:MAG: hypothetical protein A2Z43_01145 [Syntrophobacterales bacterium RBG_19FT_COMBO_59_10]
MPNWEMEMKIPIEFAFHSLYKFRETDRLSGTGGNYRTVVGAAMFFDEGQGRGQRGGPGRISAGCKLSLTIRTVYN